MVILKRFYNIESTYFEKNNTRERGENETPVDRIELVRAAVHYVTKLHQWR